MDTAEFFGSSTPSGGAESSGAAVPSAPAGSPASDSAPTTAPASFDNAGDFVADFYQRQQQAEPVSPEVQPDTPAVQGETAEQSADDGSAAVEEQFQVPETDDDLKALPQGKFVEDLRGTRQLNRTLTPKAKAYDSIEQVATQAGVNPDLIPTGVELFGGLLATAQVPALDETGQPLLDPATGQPVMQETLSTRPFLDKLEALSEGHVKQLSYDLVSRDPQSVLQLFFPEELAQQLGLDPKLLDVYRQVQPDGTLNGHTLPTAVNSDILSKFNATDHELVKTLDPDAQSDLAAMEEGLREKYLAPLRKSFENDKRLKALEQQQVENAQKEAQAKAQAQEAARERRLQEFTQEQNRLYETRLKTYEPFGPGKEHADDNAWVQSQIDREVRHTLFNDPAIARQLDGLAAAVRKGDQLTQAALLSQVNVHLDKAHKAVVAKWDGLFQRMYGREQSQRDAHSQLRAVPNSGGWPQARTGGNGLANPSDLSDPANIQGIAEQLGIRMT